MKKFVSLLCICALLSMCLCACSEEKSTGDVTSGNAPGFSRGESRGESSQPDDISFGQDVSNTPDVSEPPTDETTTDESSQSTTPDVTVSEGDAKYEIKWAGFSKIGNPEDNEWLFRAILQNTGDVPIFCNTCAADVETESGELVGKMEFMNFEPCIVMPGNYAYMTATEYFSEYTGDELLSATPRFDIEKSIRPAVQYDVTDMKVSKDDYGAIHILGYVNNGTSVDEDNMKLVFTLFSSEGYLFTETAYVNETVKAGGKVSFDEVIYPEWYDCEVEAVSDLFCVGIPAFEYSY